MSQVFAAANPLAVDEGLRRGCDPMLRLERVNLLAAGNPTDLALRIAYGNACASPEALAKLLDP